MPEPIQPTPVRKQRTNWRLIALVLIIVAGSGRLLLFLLAHGHAKTGAMPTWPVRVGDVFPVKPGDPVIAKWAALPDNNGFLVELAEQDGHKVTPKVCALEPDYMAATGQPGGSLSILAQAREGEWRVGWHGGDTITNDGQPEHTALNCGRNAVVLMTSAELLSWLKMQTGEPDEYPVMSNDKMYRDVTPDAAPPTH